MLKKRNLHGKKSSANLHEDTLIKWSDYVILIFVWKQ